MLVMKSRQVVLFVMFRPKDFSKKGNSLQRLELFHFYLELPMKSMLFVIRTIHM